MSATPFRNPTAWKDLTGQLDLYHAVLAQTISETFGISVIKLPLGDGRADAAWLDALTRQFASECQALALDGPASYSEFDLKDPGEFASFTFQLSNDLQRVRVAAGVL